MKKKNNATDLQKQKAQPLGDTGDGDTGVPDAEQGISNRAGDREEEDDEDEFEEDFDELDDAGDGSVGKKEQH